MSRLVCLLIVIAALAAVGSSSARDSGRSSCWGRCVSEAEKRSAREAIRYVFRGYSAEAIRVASCESGLSRLARNGQYLGLFQMGSSERARYGHGASSWQQAVAAYRYFAASGFDWSPWSCRP